MTAASYWLLSLLLLFCKSNLGIVLTEREEVLNDPVQDKDGWCECTVECQANGVSGDTVGDNGKCYSCEQPDREKDEYEPLFIVVDHRDTYLDLF